MHSRHVLAVTGALVAVTACQADDASVAALATRLMNDYEGAEELTSEYRQFHISCGARALSDVPNDKIDAALKAPTIPEIWAVLGSDTLDEYVRVCREGWLELDDPPMP